jgi:asparagine synthase (glutamine-hydrolysing)
MCGIVGFAGFDEPSLLKNMCDAITHRGPDDEGQIHFPEHSISLGMRRLSIIDLDGGVQPMSSADGDVTLVYNGEIYNHQNIRKELINEGASFQTDCDTEVILQGYLRWGKDILHKLRGMFAFAIFDKRSPQDPELWIVRDHVGMKPLYYAVLNEKLLFASELKALLCYPDLPKDINTDAIAHYLSYRFTPQPDTFFKLVKKLPAGHCLSWKKKTSNITRWWTPPKPAEQNIPSAQNDQQAQQDFEEALNHAVKRHMIADVPVGIFLSGGVDSTIIAALMAQHDHGNQKLNSFTACFPDYKGNEGQDATDTAQHLGFNSHLVECRAAHIAGLPQIVRDLDEPVGDPIILPMWLLGQATRPHNKVVLSGEGADEILGGYVFHKNILRLHSLKQKLPETVWPILGTIFGMTPLTLLNRLFDYPGQFGSEGRKKLSALLKDAPRLSLSATLTRLVCLFEGLNVRSLKSFHGDNMNALSHLTQLHYDGWLEDNILWKSDKMNMAHSVEGRIPFMDEAVLKAVAALPDHLKLNKHGNKQALRNYAKKLLPSHLLDRPKKAFYVPIEQYQHSSPLKDLYAQYLDDTRISKRGLISAGTLRTLKTPIAHAGFLPDKRIFSLLMLELWFDAFAPDYRNDGSPLI